MSNNNLKYEYATKILGAIQEAFHDEDSEYHIDIDDFQDSDKLTMFIHALATIAPNSFYNQITNKDLNNLEFNHIANRLCFQFSNSV